MSPIAAVVQHYHPRWTPPDDRREWNPVLCPAHEETRPSAAVSYEHDAITCHGCGYRGDVIGVVRREEKLGYAAAVERAKEILLGCGGELPRPVQPKPRSRRVFGAEGAGEGGDEVQSRVRGRSSPWA